MPQTNEKRNQFVDFKALRKSLPFDKVLELYGVKVQMQKGNRHVGHCPLPTHDFKTKTPSFSAKLDFGIWRCHACGAGGNVIEFAVRMEGLDPNDMEQFRSVALKLQEKFGAPPPAGPEAANSSPMPKPADTAAKPQQRVNPLPILINQPLDFELKGLDFEHPYLKNRGIAPETIRQFGLGYCNRGLMTGRLVIPLHNADNQLIGYAGRVVDDAIVSDKNPKYRFPSTRDRDQKVLVFKKSLLLYNLNRLKLPVSELIVCQGFPATWWLTQHGWPNVVAVMGADCSTEQGQLIKRSVSPDGHISILCNAGQDGERCAASIFADVAPRRWVRWVKLPHGRPTEYTPGDLEELFSRR
jgi:DNA primase